MYLPILPAMKMIFLYSNYNKITLGQDQFIDFAIKYAHKTIFIKTNLVTTKHFIKISQSCLSIV